MVLTLILFIIVVLLIIPKTREYTALGVLGFMIFLWLLARILFFPILFIAALVYLFS